MKKWKVCSVCGNTISNLKKEKTVVTKRSEILNLPTEYSDVMDCSNCGCQIILNTRYIHEYDNKINSKESVGKL